MLDEMSALHNNRTWELILLPFRKSVVGCWWIFAIKVSACGTIDRLKVRLVAKDYTQIFIMILFLQRQRWLLFVYS